MKLTKVVRRLFHRHEWFAAYVFEDKFLWRPYIGEVDAYRDYNPSDEEWGRAASGFGGTR